MNLLGFLGPIANLGSQFLANRQEQSQAKHQAKMEQIKSSNMLESKLTDSMATSWKDELILITLLAPVWIVFYGALTDQKDIIIRVEGAFEALNTCPDWFFYCLFIAVSVSYGVRSFDKLMSLKKGK